MVRECHSLQHMLLLYLTGLNLWVCRFAVYRKKIHYYIPANPKQASRGGSTLCFDQWQKVVSKRPHFPTVKHTPAKESKVHNGGVLYPRPDLRISWSLYVWGSPARTWNSRSITAGALTLTLILFPQLFWGPSPPGTALSASQILPTKDLRDLLRDNLFKE